MIFADKLIRLRRQSGWSQEELAEQMNVTRQSVSKWEGAQAVPDLEKILRLSQLFGVSTDYLLKDEIETVEPAPEAEESTLRRVSMEEANAFLAAKAAGLTHLTHFFNQMSPLHHREIGLVGAGFADNDIKIELICDKLHVKPDIIKIVFNTKPVDQIILITDSLLASGLPDGKYVMGGLEMFVKNREARLASGALMGSTLPYQFGLRNVHEITGMPLKELVKATSWNQAQSLGLQGVGKIEKGYKANIVLLDKQFNVMGTMVKGELRYRNEALKS